MTGRDEILVGVDGSQHSDAAVIWAAAEAASRGCGLMVVHAFDASSIGIWTTTAAIRSDLRAMSQWVVDDALRLAAEHQPGVPVRGRVLFGSPTRLLLLLSKSAQLTVVGRNGHGALTHLWLGSTTQRILAHASSPAVAVSGGAGLTTLGTVSRIVVGMQEGPAEDAVLEFAFSEAQRRCVPLKGLHVVAQPAAPFTELIDDPCVEHVAADERQAKALNRWHTRFPSVAVTSVVHSGPVGDVFRAEYRPSDLLVLGHRRHAPFVPHQLGRTASAALHNTQCAVAVVHALTANAARPTEHPWSQSDKERSYA